MLCGCGNGGNNGSENNNSSNNNGQGEITPDSKEDNVISKELVVEKTKAQLLKETMKETNYDNIFTVNLPEGWDISIGGADWYLWIRIYDPDNPSLQLFSIISTTCILKSYAAQNFYKNAASISTGYYYEMYNMSANMVVNESATMEEFFEDWEEYISWIAQYDETFNGFDYPLINSFETIESWDSDDIYRDISIDDKLIHAEYVEGLSQQRAEGMFSGAFTNGVAMYADGTDCGYYTVYNVNGISAPYGMLGEYQEVLLEILRSINYNENWVNQAMKNQEASFENAQQLNQILQQTSQIIVDGWYARQQSYDRISQAYSDSTLGYDRYYDTETGEVYRVEYGVMDNYYGDRYELVTGDSAYYSLPVSGYVYK